MRLDIVRKIGWFAVYTVFLQIALILMFMGFVRYDSLYDGYIWNSTKVYGHDTPDLNHFYPSGYYSSVFSTVFRCCFWKEV